MATSSKIQKEINYKSRGIAEGRKIGTDNEREYTKRKFRKTVEEDIKE